MYEFDTVSASSYDPSALASKLTQKSVEGWEIVSIVPSATEIIAFVRRETSGTATSAATPAAEPVISWSGVSSEPADTVAPSYEPTIAPAAEEPAGWGAVTATSDAPWATTTSDPMPQVAPEPVVEAAPEPVVAVTPEPDPASTASVPSVPAGWYADPAGRFELRYWDGGQWTEHVARGGSQYTDPPVA